MPQLCKAVSVLQMGPVSVCLSRDGEAGLRASDLADDGSWLRQQFEAHPIRSETLQGESLIRGKHVYHS